MRDYGTSPDYPYSGGLERACARPKHYAFGEPAYPTLEEKVSALIHSIITNHVFVDGNKRTGIMAGMVMLDVNGSTVVASTDEMTQVAKDIQSKAMTREGLVEWMSDERNVLPVTPSEIEGHPTLFDFAHLIDPLE